MYQLGGFNPAAVLVFLNKYKVLHKLILKVLLANRYIGKHICNMPLNIVYQQQTQVVWI